MSNTEFNPMLRVFQDDVLQNQMEKNGYVVVPFYTQEEIKELLEIFNEFPQNKGVSGFFSSTFSQNIEYRKKANESIIAICDRHMKELLVNYKVWVGSFLVKASDENSALSVHQDMTLMDESKFSGFNIWCPLIDLEDNNGPLMVLPGSHRIIPTLRGSTIPGIYENTHEHILKLMTKLIVKAGTAVIFDQSIIHASPPNRSKELRVVTNTFFTHEDASIRTCYFDKEKNKVEIFKQDDDFMVNYANFGYDIHSRPTIGQSIGFVDYDFPQLTIPQLDELYGPVTKETRISNKKSLLQRLLNFKNFFRNSDN